MPVGVALRILIQSTALRIPRSAAEGTPTQGVLHERLAGGGQLGAQVGARADRAPPAVQQQVIGHRRLALVPPPQRVQQRSPLEAQSLHLYASTSVFVHNTRVLNTNMGVCLAQKVCLS